jgi:hypothetical protein
MKTNGIVGDDDDSPRGSTDAEALKFRVEVVVRDELYGTG